MQAAAQAAAEPQAAAGRRLHGVHGSRVMMCCLACASGTSNSMHDESEGEGYHNITTLTSTKRGGELGEGSIELDQKCENGESDLIDALFIAGDLLARGTTTWDLPVHQRPLHTQHRYIYHCWRRGR
mmetsp:Transcript_3803/g.9518  ORF Transcript_3803/g.9518 Transcript_3803/m.9518 type:complete len:127 (+) Transcript_3803:323-703(+)